MHQVLQALVSRARVIKTRVIQTWVIQALVIQALVIQAWVIQAWVIQTWVIQTRVIQTLVLLSAATLWPSPAIADNLFRIAAWNIADFHHEVGVEARENIGTRRFPKDFKTLQKYANALDADIIALQEIVTKEAARLLFPVERFWLFMSSRYLEDQQSGADADIYTALVVRKGVGIKPLQQLDLPDLQIRPVGNNPYERSTRRGTVVEMEVNGMSLWVMSVHLKSSCAKVKKVDRSRQTACKMLWRQSLSLKRWIDEKIAIGSHFIIAGDFNRRFGRLKNKGEMWKLLTQPLKTRVAGNGSAGSPLLVRFPTTKLRRCPTRKGKGIHPIDWFVVNAGLATQFLPNTYFETRWSQLEVDRHRNRLSDHCPIHIDFMID